MFWRTPRINNPLSARWRDEKILKNNELTPQDLVSAQDNSEPNDQTIRSCNMIATAGVQLRLRNCRHEADYAETFSNWKSFSLGLYSSDSLVVTAAAQMLEHAPRNIYYCPWLVAHYQ